MALVVVNGRRDSPFDKSVTLICSLDDVLIRLPCFSGDAVMTVLLRRYGRYSSCCAFGVHVFGRMGACGRGAFAPCRCGSRGARSFRGVKARCYPDARFRCIYVSSQYVEIFWEKPRVQGARRAFCGLGFVVGDSAKVCAKGCGAWTMSVGNAVLFKEGFPRKARCYPEASVEDDREKGGEGEKGNAEKRDTVPTLGRGGESQLISNKEGVSVICMVIQKLPAPQKKNTLIPPPRAAGHRRGVCVRAPTRS